MKNKITSIILMGMMLFLGADISSALILDVYGTMEGTTNVSAPEFYIGSITDEELLINEEPFDCDSFTIDGEYRTFQTKDLGGIDFKYTPKVKFYVRAKTTGPGSQDIALSFGYYNNSDNLPHYICSDIITVGSTMSNYSSNNFIQCSEKPMDVKSLFYEFQEIEEICGTDGPCPSIEYVVGKCEGDFYTKIKLSN